MDGSIEMLSAGYRIIKQKLGKGTEVEMKVPEEDLELMREAANQTPQEGHVATMNQVPDSMDKMVQARYIDQINRVMFNDNPPDIIKVGKTPDILKNYGAGDREITMRPAMVRKIVYPH